jgi:hypothetical protein
MKLKLKHGNQLNRYLQYKFDLVYDSKMDNTKLLYAGCTKFIEILKFTQVTHFIGPMSAQSIFWLAISANLSNFSPDSQQTVSKLSSFYFGFRYRADIYIVNK